MKRISCLCAVLAGCSVSPASRFDERIVLIVQTGPLGAVRAGELEPAAFKAIDEFKTELGRYEQPGYRSRYDDDFGYDDAAGGSSESTRSGGPKAGGPDYLLRFRAGSPASAASAWAVQAALPALPEHRETTHSDAA